MREICSIPQCRHQNDLTEVALGPLMITLDRQDFTHCSDASTADFEQVKPAR